MNQTTAAIFKPVPTKNPRNAPHATLNAGANSPLLCINSPTSAPQNGPKIIPKGPTNKPIIKPIVEPVVAALLPPVFFVIVIGKTLSKTETSWQRQRVCT